MAHRTATFVSISSTISQSRTPSAVVTVLPACGRLMLYPLGNLHVDQERADGKIAMIVLADHTPGQPVQQ
jgi:hypothetical protein